MPLDQTQDFALSRRAMRAEMLDADTELQLAYAWRDHKDEAALHRLITAYMRLAVSMASKFRRYGAPMNDLIQEATLGLMKAADKFDPDRGVRFSTYAVWWIKASIQDYVMRNWSIVRTGSTSSQKSLFFNFKRVQAELLRDAEKAGEEVDPHQLRQMVAMEIGVSLSDVEMMEGRLSGSDYSLNAQRAGDEDGREWVETVEDTSEQAEAVVTRNADQKKVRQWLAKALSGLTEREQKIIGDRMLVEKGKTLETLGQELRLSKERVRQIEAAALGKLRKSLEAMGADPRLLLG